MKPGWQLGFWSLRPRSAAGRLELACWLTTAILAAGLVTAVTPSAGAAAAPRPVAARPENSNLLVWQRRCIDRVMGMAADHSEEAVVEQINLQCFAPRPTAPVRAAGLLRPACQRIVALRVTVLDRRAAGCPGG